MGAAHVDDQYVHEMPRRRGAYRCERRARDGTCLRSTRCASPARHSAAAPSGDATT